MSQFIADMQNSLRFDSLSWVNDELRQLLVDIQRELENISRSDNTTDIQQTLSILDQLTGTLSLIEIKGASLLSKEMSEVLTAYAKNEIEKKEYALELLISSALRIEDYLDYLSSGNSDIPALLLPIINDLREIRNADLMSDKVIFMPDFQSAMDTIQIKALESDNIQQIAKKRRIAYQVGLLDLLRNENKAVACARMQAVLNLLYQASKERLPANMWWIATALVDVYGEIEGEEKLHLLMMFGQLDRHIKMLIDRGEDGLQRAISFELIKNMLYFLAKSEQQTERVSQAKNVFKLDDYLIKDLRGQTSSWLGPPNKQLIDTVSKALVEDVNSIKDVIDVYSHSDRANVASLAQASEVMQKIGDTLTMLGLGATKDRIMSEKGMLDQHIQDNAPLDDEAMMLIASVLLTIEEDLQAYRDNRETLSDAQSDAANDSNDDTSVIAENRQVTSTLANEALRDLSWVKDVYLDYLQTDGQIDLLSRVPKVMRSIAGAMFVDPLSGIVTSINELKDYVENVLIAKVHQPNEREQNIFAEVITNIECFLEATVESRLDAELFIDAANLALDELESASPSIEDAVLPEPVSEDISAITGDLENLVSDMDIESPLSDIPVVDIQDIEEPIVIEESVPVAPIVEPSAAVKSAPAQPKGTDYSHLQVVASDADSEIIEIFIEEAQEELARVSEMFPQWRANPENSKAVTVIRRSFHTLKGSGRIVGAQLIGEFAWKFENLLNRIIDGTVDVNENMFDAIAAAIPILPGLIGQIQGQASPSLDAVYQLMDRAEALSSTQVAGNDDSDILMIGSVSDAEPESIQELPVVEVSPDVPDDSPLEEVLEFSSMEPETLVGASEEIQIIEPELDVGMPADPEPLAALETESTLDSNVEIKASIEEPQVDATQVVDALQVSTESPIFSDVDIEANETLMSLQSSLEADIKESSGDLDAADLLIEELDPQDDIGSSSEIDADEIDQLIGLADELPSLEDIAAAESHTVPTQSMGPEVDVELIRIFSDEVSVHLKTIEKFVDEASSSTAPLHGDESLYRAFHTIHGSAKTSPTFTRIATLSEDLEQLYNAFKTLGMPWSGDDLENLRLSLTHIRGNLDALAQGKTDFNDGSGVHNRVAKRYAEVRTKLTAQYKVLTDTQAFEVDEELVDVFMEEGEELLEILDRSVHNAVSKDAVDNNLPEILRVLHTLKGSARMANLTAIGDLGHTLETVFVDVAENKLSFNDYVKAVVQRSTDQLSNMIHMLRQNQTPADVPELIEELNDLVKYKGQPKPLDASDELETPEPMSEDLVNVSSTMQAATEAEVTPPPVEQKQETVEPEQPAAPVISAPVPVSPPVQTVAPDAGKQLFAEHKDKQDETLPAAGRQDMVRVQAGRLENLVNFAGEVNIFQSRLGQYINDIGNNLLEVDNTLDRLRNQLRSMELETEAQIASGMERERDDPDKDFDPLEMDRYSNMQHLTRAISESADDLMNIKSTLGDLLRESESAVLQQSRVTTDLQDGLLKTQMVSFEGLVSRFRRLVRQTSHQLNKKVEISIKGFDTEIDRSVQVSLISSLEHMLRNAIYHGIELPSERAKVGKPDTGRINMEVRRDGSYIVIQINDDGAGIDPTKVRNKAITAGLIKPDQEIDQKDILQLILKSGFTTADEISQIAGRGVGMDVVDTQIKELGGSLQIDSSMGIGSSFSIRLPQTLSISNGLMIEMDETPYVVLLSAINGIATISGEKLQEHIDGDFSAYEYGNEIYPVHYLGSLLNVPVTESLKDKNIQIPLVFIKGAGRKVALIVDKMLGKRELVVKPVGVQMSIVRGVSGATILGDGSVSFILDPIELLQARYENLPDVTQSSVKPAIVPAVVTQKVVVKQKIMVVDDSITIRKVSQRLLERNGYEVILAKDGVDAIEQLASFTPDLFLLDIEMPRMDGFELTSNIRNTEKTKGLPIIMITSRTGAKHRERAEALSVNCYLGKPFQEAELIKEIQSLIGD